MLKQGTFALASAAIVALGATGGAFAAELAPSSYDITRTRLSGSGSWLHTYDGNITANGDGTYSYEGGSGTLNDGVLGDSRDNTHLFYVSDGGQITFNFEQLFAFDSFELFSFGGQSNTIPGNISALDVTINGQTQTFLTSAFGPSSYSSPSGAHERILLGAFGGPTNQVTLSNFQTTGGSLSYYSISEAKFFGEPANVTAPPESVPEPASMMGLLAVGAVAAGGVLKKKQAT